jgi:hypothetical protein
MMLSAQMPLEQILETAKASKRYQDDFDFHLLVDWLERLAGVEDVHGGGHPPHVLG